MVQSPDFYVKIKSMKDKRKVINKISDALNANDLDSARKLIENDLKRVGSREEYYFYQALITKDLNKKLELYTLALDLNNKYLDAWINRGLVNNELGNYDASLKDYDKAVELDSKCALAFNNRGYTKFKQQNYEGALADYNKAILLNPKFQMALDNKAQLFQTVCMKDDKDFNEKYYLSLGICDVNEGNFPEALKSFDEVLKLNENSELAYFYKGICYHSLGKTDEAYTNYTNAIKLDKNMVDAYFNRGQLMFKINQKQALDDFVSAVALDAKFIDAYYSIASIQKNLGQYKEAIMNLDKIIELEPQAVNAKALKKLILTKYLK